MRKVLFADQLRGLAFICVVIVHWLGVFRQYDLMSYVTGAPAIDLSNHNLYENLLPGLPNFNYGPFGVSLFFLISGFVIPFSMDSSGRGKFIVSRALRIYPVYIISSLVMLLFYFSSHLYWGAPVHLSIKEVIANITLTSSILDYPSIDLINWTLEIEIKFYLIMFIFFNSIKSANIGVILIPLTLLIAFSVSRNFHIFDSSYKQAISFHNLRVEMTYISYMFLGVLINRLYKKDIGVYEFIIASAFLILIVRQTSIVTGVYNIELCYNYAYGYIVFLACYLLNKSFKPNKALSFLSRISYPFYALHSIIGYCSIRYLLSLGVSHAIAFIITFMMVTGLAFIINTTVETPVMKATKRIFAK